MILFKIKNIRHIAIVVSSLSLLMACGGGGSGSADDSSGSHSSSVIADKEFIAIIRNENEDVCQFYIDNLLLLDTFTDPVASIESNSISCASYGRDGDVTCSVIELEINGPIACVTGHNGLSSSVAIDIIEDYAEDNSVVAPSVSDYMAAGVNGVTEDNLEQVNALIASLSAIEVDTVGEIQAIIDGIDGSSGEDITHNDLAYKTVTSTDTGKVWLDRNLGASTICAATDSAFDHSCFGDFYQWGREHDGHQSSIPLFAEFTSEKTSSINTESSLFVRQSEWIQSGLDDLGTIRASNWAKADGTSICPTGFKVPSKEELEAEVGSIANSVEALDSFLKLPRAGLRNALNADKRDLRSSGNYWTTSPSSGSEKSSAFVFRFTSASISDRTRGSGYSVRCIKAE